MFILNPDVDISITYLSLYEFFIVVSLHYSLVGKHNSVLKAVLKQGRWHFVSLTLLVRLSVGVILKCNKTPFGAI